jgi:hypothetical protein
MAGTRECRSNELVVTPPLHGFKDVPLTKNLSFVLTTQAEPLDILARCWPDIPVIPKKPWYDIQMLN